MNFEKAFERLIGHEGGYSTDRNDPGNWTGGKVGSGTFKGTKYGIAANTYPNLDIKNLDCLGVSPVDNISCSFSNPLNGVNLWTEVSSNNVITVFMKNPTTNVIDLASGILSVKIL